MPVQTFRSAAKRIVYEIVKAPLEPILHASPLRIKFVGVFALLGQPFFGWVWQALLPQPYENMALRLMVASFGILLVWNWIAAQPESKTTQWTFGLVMWVQLPLLFTWLYLQNDFSAAWFGSMVAMLLIYFQLTDWRLAIIGLLAAVGLTSIGTLVSSRWLWTEVPSHQWLVFLFATLSALVLSASAANLRRMRLEDSLATMGILAHELRTPLATLSLLGDAVRGEGAALPATPSAKRLDNIAGRIYALSRSMNQQIDTQIANASLLRLRPSAERVSAISVVQAALAEYPFRGHQEREMVELDLTAEFEFIGSERLFVQVLTNLLKNALRAVAAVPNVLAKPIVRIELGTDGEAGWIRVHDSGGGIDPKLQRRIFEPFFSTQKGTGHGLGLAFCQAVVASTGGSIGVSSTPGLGSTFTINLPVSARITDNIDP